MAQIIGLTACKINGIFRVDVRNARWRGQKVVNQVVTQGGVKIANGVPLISGSFDEIIPKTAQFDWAALTEFSIQLYDFETRSVLLMAAEGCEWESIDGQTDLGSANTSKSIAWKGRLIPKL